MENYQGNNMFFYIIKGVMISILFTMISLFVFSCLLVYTNISENLMQPVIIVITGISIFLGSSIGNSKAKKNGIVNGGFISLIYMIFIYMISSLLSGNFALNIQSVIMIAIGFLGGIVGGIIGVNIK